MSRKGFRVELNSAGVQQLLNDGGLSAVCASNAQRIASKAGKGFRVSRQWQAGYGGGRTAVSVRTVTPEAREAEATNKTLTLAVQSCRA